MGASRGETDEIAREFHDAGVTHIVALRGDSAEGAPFTPHPDGYRNAAELVRGLRRIADFEISVAAYPEIHPDAVSSLGDLDNLKRKLDGGATRCITQFFFDSDVFLRFVERVRMHGIQVPIVPDILAPFNFNQVVRMSRRSDSRLARAFPWRRHKAERARAVDREARSCGTLQRTEAKNVTDSLAELRLIQRVEVKIAHSYFAQSPAKFDRNIHRDVFTGVRLIVESFEQMPQPRWHSRAATSRHTHHVIEVERSQDARNDGRLNSVHARSFYKSEKDV